MKKTILYIGGFVLPDGNAAAHRVVGNAKILDKLGFNIVFLGTSNQQLSKNVTSTFEIIKGFSSYKVNYPTNLMKWLFYLTSIKNIKKIINEIGVENLDTIIAYNYPSIALNRLLTFSRKNNVKLISDCTEWAVEPSNNSIRAILKNIDTYFRMRFVHPKLDGLIAISKYLFDFYSTKMNNVICVPPLVDLSEEKRRANGLKRYGKLRLVYAGSPGGGNKDRLDVVINALSKIKNNIERDFVLTIVGITKDQYLLNTMNSNLPSSVSDNIIFRGIVPHIEAINEVKRSDFSIFLRDDNLVNKAGFPTKFVESISCGTPVITNTSCNILDYLKEEKLGRIVSVESEENLIQSLSEVLLLTDEEINEMKRYCQSLKKFDYSNYINSFENLIKNL